MKDADWQSKDGANVKEIWWPDTDEEKGRHALGDANKQLVCRVEYMGDHTEVWIAVVVDGIETVRHNARKLETIIWI